jgi:hypothetical protein
VAVLCGGLGVGVHYAVLRADFDTCVERSRRRDPTGPADLDGFTSLHRKFVDLGHREAHAIDTSDRGPRVSNAVLSAFREGLLVVEQRASGEVPTGQGRP